VRLVVLVVVLALAGCSASAGPSGVTYLEAPPTAPPAPAFTLELLDGTTLDLAEQWQTRPVVLVFFESWCELCAQRQPDITALSEEYGDTVLFVGVGRDSSAAAVTEFRRDHDIDYPVGLDPDGETWRRYRVDEPPLIALITKGGRFVRGWPGGTTELGDHIQRYLIQETT
jgi:peroxiredoxin